MARLGSVGFELNSVASGVEFGISGSPLINSTVVRSGTYAGQISSLVSTIPNAFQLTFASANGNGPYYFRFYLNIDTLPTGNNDILFLQNSANTNIVSIALTSTGTLLLQTGVSTLVGSASPALNKGQWYRIELLFDNTGGAAHGILTGLIDGIQWATSSTLSLTSGAVKNFIGGNLNNETQTVGKWYFDDWAINDNTGASQTSYPGSGRIVHLRPSTSGDVNTFATQTGGTAGSSNNFTRVKEVTPDDATSFNGSSTLNQEDLFNCDDPLGLLGENVTINLVCVGGRIRNSTADSTAAIKFEIEKTASGTITQSSAIIPNTTTWNTNRVSSPFSPYPINSYNDPDGNAWTLSTLTSLQIGYKLTAAPGTSGRRIDCTSAWALVEYVDNFPKNLNINQTINRASTY